MKGIVIRYSYGGDEDAWRTAIDGFISAINADEALAGKLSYAVNISGDGKTRIHVGRWDTDETLATLQSRDYFKTFAGQVKDFAGDTLDAQRVSLVTETG